MSGPIVDIGRDLVAFVAGQDRYKIHETDGTADDAGEAYPEAADALRLITATAGGTYPYATREDKFGTATYIGGIQQKATAEGSIEAYLLTDKDSSTPPRPNSPPVHELLEYSGWTRTRLEHLSTAIDSGGGGGVRVINVDSAASFSAGDAIRIENDDGGYELRKITDTDTGATPDTITVEPPLTFTPSAGKEVRGAIWYIPNDDRDGGNLSTNGTADALALWIMNNNSADRVSSWAPDSFSFSMGGDSAARLSVSGGGRGLRRLITTGLTAPLATGSAASVDITVADGYSSSADYVGSYWTLISGVLVSEVIRVKAIDGNTWTIQRAQLATSDPGSNWPAGTQLQPYRPAGTYAGDPVAATSGSIVIAPYGATTGLGAEANSLQCSSATVDCSFGVTTRDQVHGTKFLVDGYVMAKREVSISLSGWTLKNTNMRAQALAFLTAEATGAGSSQVTVAVQQGEAPGTSFALLCPRVRVTVSSLERGAEEVALDLSGMAEGTTAGGDEVMLIFG